MSPRLDLFIKALITGFGYKLGAEVGRKVATRLGILDEDKAKAEEAEEDLPEGIPIKPGENGGDPFGG
jgi:hypothetical protein